MTGRQLARPSFHLNQDLRGKSPEGGPDESAPPTPQAGRQELLAPDGYNVTTSVQSTRSPVVAQFLGSH